MASVPRQRGRLSLHLKVLFLLGQSTAALLVAKFFVYDHQMNCWPGAFSHSTIFEWTFAACNLAFDATLYFELSELSTIVGAEAFRFDGPADVALWRGGTSHGALLWAFDVGFAYLFVASFLQMGQQVYFVPMVAMQFTPEVALALSPPLVSLLVSFLPPVRRLAHGELSVGSILYLQRWLVGGTLLSLISLFHVEVQASSRLKIIVAAVGPHVLLAAFRLRGLAASAKVAALERAATDRKQSARSPSCDTVEVLLHNAWQEKVRLVYAFPFAFALSMAVRWWGASEDVLMNDPFWNGFTFFALLSVAVLGPLRTHSFEGKIVEDSADPLSEVGAPAVASMPAAVAFGALFNLSVTLISAPGTMARYVAVDPLRSWWAPLSLIIAVLVGTAVSPLFRIGQPMPLFTGRGTLLAAATAVSVGVLYYGTTQSNRFFQVHADKLEDWTMEDMSGSPTLAFVGGALLLGFCLAAWWPYVAAWNIGAPAELVSSPRDYSVVTGWEGRQLRSTTFARADAVSYSIIIVFVLLAVYVVCFPFVPGGMMMRDRMNWVLFGLVALLLVASSAAHSRMPTVRRDMVAAPLNLLRAVTPVSISRVLALFVGIVFAGRMAGFSEAPSGVYKRADGREAVDFRAAIWTIHFSTDNFAVDSMARLTQWVREAKVDAVGLLESDMQRVVNGNRDIVEYMAYHLGYQYSDYGPTTLDSTFGCALVSKYPIRRVHRMVMPSPQGELACLIHAWVEVLPAPHPLVHVYVGHFGNTEHVQDRVLQSEVLGKAAVDHHGPSVFLGYLTTKPGYKNYYRMVQSDGDAVDEFMKSSMDPFLRTHDDGTKTFEGTEMGFKLPDIPIKKRRAGLWRDTARDMLLGLPSRVEGEALEATPYYKELHGGNGWKTGAMPAGGYWSVNALATRLAAPWLVDDRRSLSPELLRETALEQRVRKVEAAFRSRGLTVGEYKEPSDAESMVRLQRAAQAKAVRMVRGLHDTNRLQDDVPSDLRSGLEHLQAHTHPFGRTSNSMFYLYPKTGRVSQRHPRHEYEDRYCQYVLYRDMPLLDWYRVLDIDELSDTELQVVTFRLAQP